MAFTRSGVRLPLAPPSSAVFGRLASYEKFLTGAYACLEAHVALSNEKQATNSERYLKSPSCRAFSKSALKTFAPRSGGSTHARQDRARGAFRNRAYAWRFTGVRVARLERAEPPPA